MVPQERVNHTAFPVLKDGFSKADADRLIASCNWRDYELVLFKQTFSLLFFF